MLEQGHHLLITEELHEIKKLNLGDTFELKNNRGRTIDFIVAGVVWSPGIDVMVSTFDVQQQFEQQSLACVFGSLADAKNLFGVDTAYIMSANFKKPTAGGDGGPVGREQLVTALRDSLGDKSLFVADVRQIKYQIQTSMGHLLTAAGVIAWAALAVASLGVANTIVAGVRTRSWQFGILRSVGLLRGVLLRVILAEAVLLGVHGCGDGVGLRHGADLGLACPRADDARAPFAAGRAVGRDRVGVAGGRAAQRGRGSGARVAAQPGRAADAAAGRPVGRRKFASALDPPPRLIRLSPTGARRAAARERRRRRRSV